MPDPFPTGRIPSEPMLVPIRLTGAEYAARPMTADDIRYCVRYESAPGVHTYHPCDCGRGGCRGERCKECWNEELAKVEVPTGGN